MYGRSNKKFFGGLEMKDSLGLFEKIETSLADCFEIKPVVRKDIRGALIKTFHIPTFKELGLATDFQEEFHTISHKRNFITLF